MRAGGSSAGGAPVGQGGEDILLDEFAGLGLACDPSCQLVVTCEVCRRPATKECWTCGMQICEFCTLKRHWRVGAGGGPTRTDGLDAPALLSQGHAAVATTIAACAHALS